jgi:hypothetical protein
MNDITLHSKLVEFIKENELGFMSETNPETMAKYLEGCIYNYNEAKVSNDKAKDDYIKVLEGELDRYKEVTEKLIDKVAKKE